LAADAHLWAERLPEAEISFRTALAIDPFSADARFGYGYLLWRKGSPGLIPAMASQWEMALAIDPLHRLTHWHLGNGHTPLTYADHAAVADTAVRAALAPIDSLIASGQFEAAMALARTV